MSSNTIKTIHTSSFPLFALAIVPIFLLTSTSDNFNLPKEMLLLPIAVGGLVHSVLTTSRINEKKLVISLIFVLQIGMTIAAFLSEATPARMAIGYPGRANGLIYYLSLFTLVYLAIVSEIPKGQSRKVHLAIQVPLIVNVIYGLFQYLGLDPIPWINPYNPIVGTLGNPNFASTFLAVASLYYLMLAIYINHPTRILILLLSSTSIFLMIKTESIQGPILFAFGISLYVISEIYRRSRKFGLISLISLLCTGSFLLYSFLGFGPLGNLLFQYTLQLRSQYWIIAIKSALDNPLFGLGPDSYINGFRANRTIDFVKERSLDLTVDSAHNTILNFAANFGLINSIFYSAIILLISIVALEIIHHSGKTQFLPRFMAITWIALLLQSMISIEQIGLGVYQWIIGGFLFSFRKNYTIIQDKEDGKRQSSKLSGSRNKTTVNEFAGTLALVSSFLVSFLSFNVLREDAYLNEIKLWVSSGNEQIPKLDETIDKLSFISQQEWPRAVFIYNYYVISGQSEKAEITLENVVLSDVRSQEAREQFARLNNFYQRYDKEILIREKILDLDPANPQNRLALAISIQKRGDSARSKQLARELISDFADTVWAESASVILDAIP